VLTNPDNAFRTAELFLRSLRIQIEQALAAGASEEQIKTWLMAETNRIPLQTQPEDPVSDH
jgi:hypothetical protein